VFRRSRAFVVTIRSVVAQIDNSASQPEKMDTEAAELFDSATFYCALNEGPIDITSDTLRRNSAAVCN
jgi:hypothetical protein